MEERSRNNHLIGRIAELLSVLQAGHVELDQLLGDAGGELLRTLPQGPEFQAALENLRFMEEMPGGVLIYYADGGEEIIYANRALLRIFQCGSMEELRTLTGNSFRGIVCPEDLDEVERSIREQVARSKYDLDYVEYRVRRRDGQIRWIEDYGHFVRGGSGRDIFYVFLSDATGKRNRRIIERTLLLSEKRERERQLALLTEEYDKERSQLNQEYLRRLKVIEGLSANYETILYGELDCDQIRPYRLSSRTSRMFGEDRGLRSFSGYLADYVSIWVHPEEREAVGAALNVEAIRRKLLTDGSFYVNYRVVEDGEEKYLQLQLVDVGGERRASQLVMGSRRMDEEIHHEMEQKQLLAEALEKANQAIAAKDTFLSNMSHDMRTPMNAIFGFAALARKHLREPDAARSYIGRMESSARQLMGMIERVLEISAAVTGDARTQEEACDLCGIIRQVYDFMAPQAAEKNIDFTLDCSGVHHSGIYGDEEKVRQLATYLTNNAITYTKPGGRVEVTLTERGLMSEQYAVYQLEVADTGIGISQEFLARIFEPFSRERDTTHSGVHGIGLGMSIAKSIVDKMGGTISVRSEVNRGSIFTATLDFRIQPDQAQPAAEEEEASVQPRKILLVEDNEINREIATELLQELGYVIDTAPDGSVAVEKMQQARPGDYDVILMDIQMPVMNGWEAARAIRGLSDPALAKIPIIALSANVFESDLRRSAESGMNAHLAKPMDVAEVQKTIEEFL
ncbi:PAS domain-containing hybrid sensor histidine kinase/response regulator [Oscillibacter sp. 1-3]|uniref:hybrid sensor histidine kinase/response regulator n=1 Tax=Oscillibacter sp. 1-3 TaxID=1235797 RepID=UPI00033B2002|nr:PAS domain-containing hybrid sensor histidine kinase/response regulator [Oscillibacter sp. 1-3]EOS65122.1 PAS domain S-box protein [Oscillibacter sp. 1-3]